MWKPAAAFVIIAASFIVFDLAVPCEDAFILFRVTDNVLAGNGPRYNADTPADVATELGQVYGLAALRWLGWPAKYAHVVLAALALCAILALMHARGASIGAYGVLALSPWAFWAGCGLGAPLYAAVCAALVYCVRRGTARSMVLLGVIGPLIRPEFALLYFALITLVHGKHARPYAWIPFAVIIVRGAVFAGLPLAFTVKSSGQLNAGALMAAGMWIATALVVAASSRGRSIVTLVVALFPLVYLLFDNSQNIGWRLQLAYLPALLVSVRATRPWAAIVLGGMLFAPVVSGALQPDERAAVGQEIRWMHGNLLTTEAGWLPYYSGWVSSDAIGLTDARIAHGGLTDTYLDSRRFDLIMWHCYNGRPETIERWTKGERIPAREWGGTDHWNAIVDRLAVYARTRGYSLVAVANVEHDCRWYLIRPGLPLEVSNRLALSICAPAKRYPYVMVVAEIGQ